MGHISCWSVDVNLMGDNIDTTEKNTKLNSVVLVRKRTIPTERQQLVGEVSANFS
jgi:hypothetical protein